MDEIKSKFLDLLHKQQDRNLKIPSMGFTDYHAQQAAAAATAAVQQQQPEGSAANNATDKHKTTDAAQLLLLTSATRRAKEDAQFGRLPDQEILDGMEEIYFEADADCERHELMKFTSSHLDYGTVEHTIHQLKQQHKVVATKVLQHILDQRPACDAQLQHIATTVGLLQTTLADCRTARGQLRTARHALTTNSLEILATYKKRETLQALLQTLHTIRQLRDSEQRLKDQLDARNYAGAIGQLLDCRRLAADFGQYAGVAAVQAKLLDSQLLAEQQLDEALAECTRTFAAGRYAQLQRAFRLLDKRRAAVDQLHMCFVAAVPAGALAVLRRYAGAAAAAAAADGAADFEQLCEAVPADRYTQCYIELCKAFWTVLVCYYQASAWHQNERLDAERERADGDDVSGGVGGTGDGGEDDEYIAQKFQVGQQRLWSDMQAKCCTLLASKRLQQLKYEHFIQVLSIVQRLRKVGGEFCPGDRSVPLMEACRVQSMLFFRRYHAASLEEICLFVDNESWMPVSSFSGVGQLQEFRPVQAAMQRHQKRRGERTATEGARDADGPVTAASDATDATVPKSPSSLHSQEEGGAGSSMYGSAGYFYSFAEKSSPFDGGFDDAMLEEDILAGIADESSCYYSEESEGEETAEAGVTAEAPSSEQPGGCERNAAVATATGTAAVVVNNSSLNVLRCIGRYLQMCRLLHSISPNIVASMTELIDFYTFVVHDVFGSDLPVPSDNLYTVRLTGNLERIAQEVIPKVKNWPPSFAMIQVELCNPETMYGLQQRAVAVASACSLLAQFGQLRGYLNHLLPLAYRQPLHDYLQRTDAYVGDLHAPIFMCVTARICDLPGVLAAIGRLRWDINHVNVEHSAYVETINRAVQLFAMRLGGDGGLGASMLDAIWDSLAHVLTHTLVEGYALATRKCTAAGRALMQLDVAHFMSVLEMISQRRYAGHRAYVDGYIKAYYMPKAELERWCCEQLAGRVYSGKQLAALVQCVCANDRKSRQRLLQVLEQADDGGGGGGGGGSANTSLTLG